MKFAALAVLGHGERGAGRHFTAFGGAGVDGLLERVACPGRDEVSVIAVAWESYE